MGYQIRLPAALEGRQAAAFRQLAGEVSFALNDLERRLTGVLADGAVTADKLAAGAVTEEKLGPSALERISTAAADAADSMASGKSNRLLAAPVVRDNITVNAAAADVTFSAALEGYTPIGIVGYRLQNATANGGNASSTFVGQLRLAEGSIAASLGCTQSSGAAVMLTVYVLYAAD